MTDDSKTRKQETKRALKEAEESGQQAAAKVRHACYKTGKVFVRTWDTFTRNLVPVVPFRQRIFKRFAMKGLENYYRVAGGDALALRAKAGQKLEWTPVKYLGPQDVEGDKMPGWKAKGEDKVWEAGSEGRVVDYLGRTPIVLLDDDDHVEAGWLKSRIGEAIELDRHRPVFTNPELNVTVQYPDYPGGSGVGNAVADGGIEPAVDFDLQTLGQFAQDNVIDLSSSDGADGMRISHRKANLWSAERSTSEQMQMQEERGFLMGSLGESGPSMVKLLLICAAIILGTMLIIFVLPAMLGGEGSSVTELSPMMANLTGWL